MRSFATMLMGVLWTAGFFATASLATPDERALLRGLGGLRVLIEDIDDEAQRDGVDARAIQTDVELKLRLAGIIVIGEDSTAWKRGTPSFYVRISTVKAETQYGYHVSCELIQTALPYKDFYALLHLYLEGDSIYPYLVESSEGWDEYLKTFEEPFDSSYDEPLDSSYLGFLAEFGSRAIATDLFIAADRTTTRATTWSHGVVGIAPERKLREVVREATRDLVDSFINDYLAVNGTTNTSSQKGDE